MTMLDIANVSDQHGKSSVQPRNRASCRVLCGSCNRIMTRHGCENCAHGLALMHALRRHLGSQGLLVVGGGGIPGDAGGPVGCEVAAGGCHAGAPSLQYLHRLGMLEG